MPGPPRTRSKSQADFITGNGNKLQLTGAAEAQAKTGHDALTFFNWDVHNYADALEPMDDVMERLIAANGAVNATCAYLAKAEGPLGRGADQQRHADQAAMRAHQLVQEARAWTCRRCIRRRPSTTALQDGWTWEAFLKYAEAARRRTT